MYKRYMLVAGTVAGITALGLTLFGMSGAAPVQAQEQQRVCGPGQDPERDDCRRIERDRSLERDPAADEDRRDAGLISNYLNPIINFLAIIIGIVVTISIVVGGIQYASSADDPQKVAKAKSRIINAVIALLAFLFLYTFLRWLVPGEFQ